MALFNKDLSEKEIYQRALKLMREDLQVCEIITQEYTLHIKKRPEDYAFDQRTARVDEALRQNIARAYAKSRYVQKEYAKSNSLKECEEVFDRKWRKNK